MGWLVAGLAVTAGVALRKAAGVSGEPMVDDREPITVTGGTAADRSMVVDVYNDVMTANRAYMTDGQAGRQISAQIVAAIPQEVEVIMTPQGPYQMTSEIGGYTRRDHAQSPVITLSGEAMHGRKWDAKSTARHEFNHALASRQYVDVFSYSTNGDEGLTELLTAVDGKQPSQSAYEWQVRLVAEKLSGAGVGLDVVKSAYFGGDKAANCRLARVLIPEAFEPNTIIPADHFIKTEC